MRSSRYKHHHHPTLSPLSHALAIFWLVGWSLVLLVTLFRPPVFNTELMALLPSDAQNPAVELATERTAERYANNLIWVLTPEAPLTTDQIESFWASLKTRLRSDNLVDQVRYSVDLDLNAALKEEQQYRFARLNPQVVKPLLKQEWGGLTERSLQQLFGWMPTGGFNPVSDPFLLLANMPPNLTRIHSDQGLLSVKADGARHYVMQTRLQGSAFESETQEAVMAMIESAQQQAASIGASLRVSGLLLHAAAGSKQAQSEINSIGVGSLVGILVLSLVAFRSLTPFILSLIPTLVGTVFGIGITTMVLGQIHLIALAFAAGLMGVSIDYALHFLTERHQRSPGDTRRRLLPGLALGLITSVLAYSTLGFAPFPGLKQMALLCVFGLIGAWLTVVLWYPYLTQIGQWNTLNGPKFLLYFLRCLPRFSLKKMGLLSIVMMAVTAAVLYMSPPKDDLRALQTSPQALIENDQTIIRWLGLSSDVQFLMVEANDLETLLRKEESVVSMLEHAKEEGALTGFQSVSQSLPSLARQEAIKVAIKALYANALPTLSATLGLSEQQQREARATLDSTPLLTLDHWKYLPSSEAYQPLLIETDTGFIGLIKLQADAPLKQADIAPHLPSGVTWVDRVDRITQLLNHYRVEFTYGLMVGMALIIVLLTLRYRGSSPLVLIPVVLSICFTLTTLTLVFGHINLFHLMALVLVLGIGLDMGILLSETQQNPYTWLAVTLSVMTSVLAFGLLAFSATPILAAFGQTVLLGLLAVWGFGLLLRRHD